MSATTSTTELPVCLKIELRFSNGTPSVFHRFTQGFKSVDELKSLCFRLWEQEQEGKKSSNEPRLALSYSDDEGDQVIISAQHEWDECVRIYYQNKFNVLRLKVVDEQKGQQEKKSKTQTQEQKGAEDLLASVADEFFSSLFGSRSRPTSPCPFFSSRTPAASCPHPHYSRGQHSTRCQAPKSAMKRWGCRHSDTSEVRAAHEKRQRAVSNLLSILFNGDEEKAQNNHFSAANLPFGGSCVNLYQLYQEVVASGNHLMDAGCLEEADRLLTAALEVFPADKVHLYNLACVKSLQGCVDESLGLLLKAKESGYSNLTHAAADPDLENVRHSANASKFFSEFLGQQQKAWPQQHNAKTDEEQGDDDSKSVKTTVSSSPSTSASTTTNGNPDAVALVNMFPNLSFAEAEQALDRFGGDLSAAVNLLLE